MKYDLISGELTALPGKNDNFEQTKESINLNNKRLVNYRKAVICNLYSYRSQPEVH